MTSDWSNWVGDAFKECMGLVGIDIGVESFNLTYALREVGGTTSKTSLPSTSSLDLDVSSSSSIGFLASSPPTPPPSPIPFPPSFSPPVMARSLSSHSFLAPSSPPSLSSPFLSSTRERKRPLPPFSEDTGVTCCTEETECVSYEEDWVVEAEKKIEAEEEGGEG
ncbi:hypothetical protein PQX77_015614 [Marasmius sp. AFHP31]|nr:hypothetical protein PQX77_015614 [Marasmius sp. AFHP31]